jgi:hypothetical protein
MCPFLVAELFPIANLLLAVRLGKTKPNQNKKTYGNFHPLEVRVLEN